jgi:ATP-dependent Clp endopeptidase proteolytic subunit ClpP
MPRFDFRRLANKAVGHSTPTKWYDIKNVTTDTADIYIYEEIGFWGVSAQSFVRELTQLETSKINLHLNSPGGEVFDGIAIHGALKSHPADVTVYVDALAASAASFIAMAGDDIHIMRNAQMMIHQGQGFAMGPAEEFRQMADLLDKVDANIADMYASRAGGNVDKWLAAMRVETWYSAEEAVDAGLADKIIDSWEMAPESTAPGGPMDTDYDPEYAWRDRLASMRTRYRGRSNAPEPYIPSVQQNSTRGNDVLTPEPASPVVDTALVVRDLLALKGGAK